ncbi:DUF6360 family protein [Natronosalvus halobius]|uniref:DUF6360 family protein n=1 Tax=Natronosalvus halobius TaxID=2953746 RepID=UPI00209E4D10|nr:DUF6360 family protein [Natronosalvus halobius]USZ70921.1 DUF6360 family protein [Natronosalvus halobius]
MVDRLMRVTAYTTLDLADAVVTGHDFQDEQDAVVDATAARTQPDHVKLQLELDNMMEDHLPAHMEEVRLTPDQARALAADLEKHAGRVEEAADADTGSEADSSSTSTADSDSESASE